MPGVAHADWQQASSAHFVIYADDSVKEITRFAEQLEHYHSGMAYLLKRQTTVPSPSNRVTVYVVGNEREVQELHGSGSKMIAGFYLPRAGHSLAYVPRIDSKTGVAEFSMVVLLHEYAHHFLISSTSMPLPRWVQEGAAEFFASASFDYDGTVSLGRPAVHRSWELKSARDVDVSELFDPEEYERKRGRRYDAFYGKSWLLYHYLIFGDERAGQFETYIELLYKGHGQTEAAEKAFGDFRQLESELGRYKRRRRMNVFKLPPELTPISPISVRPLTPGEEAMMPVRIVSKRGVAREQAKELVLEARTIAASYPQDASVLAMLAETEYDAGNDAEAIAAADRAIAIDPGQTNAYVQKGYALFRIAAEADDMEDAYKAARQPFIALNRIENDHPLPLMYFYRSFAESGVKPPAMAVDGLVRAAELAPFDLGLQMNVGQVLVRLGRSKQALVHLTPVANNPHGGRSSQFAGKIIARIEGDPAWRGEDMALLAKSDEEEDTDAAGSDEEPEKAG